MKTVLAANRKRGVGKTAVAVTLTIALAYGGWEVALADGDPQWSASRCLKRRAKGAAGIAEVDWSADRGQCKIPGRPDRSVIDAPGAIGLKDASEFLAKKRARSSARHCPPSLTPTAPGVFCGN